MNTTSLTARRAAVTAQAEAIASRLVDRTDRFMSDTITHEELREGNGVDWKEAGASPALLAETKRVLRMKLGGQP